MTGGRIFLEKSSGKRHEGGERFWNPQRAILTFLNSEFCILPMNSVALAQDFQNKICLIAQGTYPGFWANFLWDIHTCIPEMTLKFCNNFYLLQMRGEQRQARRLYDPIQEGKQIICETPQDYVGQNAFWFVGRKSKESVTKASRGGVNRDFGVTWFMDDPLPWVSNYPPTSLHRHGVTCLKNVSETTVGGG